MSLAPVVEKPVDRRAESVAAVQAAAAPDILFVAVSPKYGGAEKHLLDLLDSFAGTGRRIQLLCTGPDVFSDRIALETRRYVTVRQQDGMASFGDWYRVFREIRPAAVVLVKSWTWCFPWYTLWAAKLAGISRRFSIIHLPPAPPAAGTADWRYRLSHRRLAIGSQADICVSEALRQRLIEDCGFPSATTITIPNGVALREFTPDAMERQGLRRQLGLGLQEVVLVCVASLIEQKRVDVLLAALAQLNGQNIRFRCVILGEGALRESLETRAVELGLSGSVAFLGFQPDVRAYLRAADIFVLTSDKEGMPLSILEAMACGLPCVVTRVGGNAELVTDGAEGYLLPPGDANAIGRTLRELIGQTELRDAMSAAARKRVQEKFDIETAMLRIRNLILNGSTEKVQL